MPCIHIRDSSSQQDTLTVERDDASKIRMNSSTTTNQHPSVTIDEGMGAVVHDYMDPEECSSLYITSYRGSKMADGAEVDIAVVKVDKLQPSTATQHFADFYMLQGLDDPRAEMLFRTPSGGVKPVVQLESDAGPDEDPSRNLVRFYQAELAMGGPLRKRHQMRAQVGSSTRSSHDSMYNAVERLNGQERCTPP